MISQKCPKCLSSRVRRGYRPTPFWSKILFRYNLLCDNCNWEFTGFAVPGTVSAKPTKSPKKKTAVKTSPDEVNSSNNPDQNSREEASETQVKIESAAAEKAVAREVLEESVVEETSSNELIAGENISAVEKSVDPAASKKVSKSDKKAKRKSGV